MGTYYCLGSVERYLFEMSFTSNRCRIGSNFLPCKVSKLHPLYQNLDKSSPANAPLIMGILNITPDSFHDGSHYNTLELAVSRAQAMIEAGVDIIDVGGESTWPGAANVSETEEIERIVPIIKKLQQFGVNISIDTSKPAVMRAAVGAGANMINDVRALQLEGALQTAVDLKVPVCLMHMQGKPRGMQNAPQYQDVIEEVLAFLQRRVRVCEEAGIDRQLLSIDPGFGFGKTLKHNLIMLTYLEKFVDLGLPVLVGLSRKSMLGEMTTKPVNQRLASSLTVALVAMQKGARIIRVHDVDETCDVRRVYVALEKLNREHKT